MARHDAPDPECLNWHIKDHLRGPKPSGDIIGGVITSYRSFCPVHPDTERSLSVSVGKRHIVWNCFADCDLLAVRAALIADGVPEDCLPIPKAVTAELVDSITALYAKDLSHTELRWRIYSLVKGLGGEMPPPRRYPGGRRGFCSEAGVSPADAYGLRGVNR